MALSPPHFFRDSADGSASDASTNDISASGLIGFESLDSSFDMSETDSPSAARPPACHSPTSTTTAPASSTAAPVLTSTFTFHTIPASCTSALAPSSPRTPTKHTTTSSPPFAATTSPSAAPSRAAATPTPTTPPPGASPSRAWSPSRRSPWSTLSASTELELVPRWLAADVDRLCGEVVARTLWGEEDE
ncbi:hypothetical protein HYH03_006245 [Edaphochlamys debaryana]|uniref:Uncharacterized protein n=1 Tax=Edaphochlamys debaryana TaxID=47281 RepID=A0A835Y402_9CHLO|nr:hypothetical protein HYH03_006245 [Edaphochlamys debaryana]|eukprot:KAG2495645.1 hypothetical protein HYH03_006245 [Edaphochlamys debaryana]